MPLRRKPVIVTGGAQGIGFKISLNRMFRDIEAEKREAKVVPVGQT